MNHIEQVNIKSFGIETTRYNSLSRLRTNNKHQVNELVAYACGNRLIAYDID